MHKILANTRFLGKELIYVPECHSTNDVALQKYKDRVIGEGTIIITEKQTKGRGQRGNSWYSEPGMNLTFSLILRPTFLEARQQFGLNMAIALGIKEALAGFLPGILVKWPNDIVHRDHGKLGGILIENTISHSGLELSIVGIGLNINQTAFPFTQATSMAQIAGHAFDKGEIFAALVESIERFYLKLKNQGGNSLMNAYIAKLYRFGEFHPFDDGEPFLGKIIGIGEQGKLIIKKANGSLHQYAFKEIRFL